MLGPINHVGYLALDLEAAIREFTETFGLRVVRRSDRPKFSLLGAYLGPRDSDPSAHIMKSEARTGSQTIVLR